MKPTCATLTKLGEVVDVAPEEGQLALVDVHELVVKRVHHSLVQVELLHGVASVKGTFKGTIESSRSPCCVLLALSWNTTNENPSTDKLSRAIN